MPLFLLIQQSDIYDIQALTSELSQLNTKSAASTNFQRCENGSGLSESVDRWVCHSAPKTVGGHQ